MNKLAVQRQSRPLLPELSSFHSFSLACPRSPVFARSSTTTDAPGRRDQGRHLRGARRAAGSRPDRGHRGHRPRRPADDQGPADAEHANRTGSRSSRTDHSAERCRCPADADEDDISATYDRGILTVSVPLSDTESSEKHVEVFEVAPLDDDEDFDDDFDDDEERDDADEDASVDQSQGEDQHRSDDGA